MIVVSPSDTGIRQARAKTDRLDARTLAKPLWVSELVGVSTPDERIRAMREIAAVEHPRASSHACSGPGSPAARTTAREPVQQIRRLNT